MTQPTPRVLRALREWRPASGDTRRRPGRDNVRLDGFVDSLQQVARAVDIARNVEGVPFVKNELVVR
jgi:hypothetical protein